MQTSLGMQGQITYGQKFLSKWNKDNGWEIVLAQDIWRSGVSSSKPWSRCKCHFGTKLSTKTLHLEWRLILFILIGTLLNFWLYFYLICKFIFGFTIIKELQALRGLYSFISITFYLIESVCEYLWDATLGLSEHPRGDFPGGWLFALPGILKVKYPERMNNKWINKETNGSGLRENVATSHLLDEKRSASFQVNPVPEQWFYHLQTLLVPLGSTSPQRQWGVKSWIPSFYEQTVDSVTIFAFSESCRFYFLSKPWNDLHSPNPTELYLPEKNEVLKIATARKLTKLY